MKKRFLTAFMAICFAFSPIHAEHYVNEKLQLQTELPEGWVAKSHLENSMVVISPESLQPKCSCCDKAVAVTFFAFPADIEAKNSIEEMIATSNEEALKNDFKKQFSFLGLSTDDYSVSTAEILGSKAVYTKMNMNIQEKKMQTEYYLFAQNDLLYVIQYTADEENFEKYMQQAHSIFDQLSFVGLQEETL